MLAHRATESPTRLGKDRQVTSLWGNSVVRATLFQNGSARESGKLCILRGFLKKEEFGLGRG
jgi:hypothetical protein